MCCWDETRRAVRSCPERPHDRPTGGDATRPQGTQRVGQGGRGLARGTQGLRPSKRTAGVLVRTAGGRCQSARAEAAAAQKRGGGRAAAHVGCGGGLRGHGANAGGCEGQRIKDGAALHVEGPFGGCPPPLRDALEQGRYPPPHRQGAQPMPSHCLPDTKCQPQ